MDFYDLCFDVMTEFRTQLTQDAIDTIRRHAWMGESIKERLHYVGKIKEMITGDCQVPDWYKDLTVESAVFEELFGHNALYSWFGRELAGSSTMCRVTGVDIFMQVDGKMQLMPQKLMGEDKEWVIATLKSIHPDNFKAFVGEDILLTRVCSSNLTCEDMALQIYDTILDHPQHELFNPNIVDWTSFESGNSFVLSLIDGRNIRVSVSEVNKDE